MRMLKNKYVTVTGGLAITCAVHAIVHKYLMWAKLFRSFKRLLCILHRSSNTESTDFRERFKVAIEQVELKEMKTTANFVKETPEKRTSQILFLLKCYF